MRSSLRYGALLVASVVAHVAVGASTVQAQSTGVYATLCAAASQITIAQPTDDSTLVTPQVTVAGTVSQANQIELYINDEFDSTIPLTIGQSQYSSTVQLPSGTHTIRVEAINSCGGQNGEAASVVTYVPPPAKASSGEGTSTQLSQQDGQAAPTVSDSPSHDAREQQAPTLLGLPPLVAQPLTQALDWLNIVHYDMADKPASLSLTRALAVVAGMYLLVLGVGVSLAHTIAGWSLFALATPQADQARRFQLVYWGAHAIGLLVLLLAFFW